jgi:hypothetical protein
MRFNSVVCSVLVLALAACAKEPPTELVSAPSGQQYKIRTHERATTNANGDVFSVVYITDVDTVDELSGEAQDLFEWAKADAESDKLDRVAITSERHRDQFFGMAKRITRYDVMFQKRDGEWKGSGVKNSRQN